MDNWRLFILIREIDLPLLQEMKITIEWFFNFPKITNQLSVPGEKRTTLNVGCWGKMWGGFYSGNVRVSQLFSFDHNQFLKCQPFNKWSINLLLSKYKFKIMFSISKVQVLKWVSKYKFTAGEVCKVSEYNTKCSTNLQSSLGLSDIVFNNYLQYKWMWQK